MKLRHILALLLAWLMLRLVRVRSWWRRLTGRADGWYRMAAWDTCVCDCGWAGPCRWCFHTYRGCGGEDVEASYECPACGEEVIFLPEQQA